MTRVANDDVVDLLRRQAILAQFGELALRSDDLDEILTQSCRLVGEAFGTDLAKVVELQDDGETLLVRAGVGWKAGVVGIASLKASDDTSEGVALRCGKPMISRDIATETRFRYAPFLIHNGVKAIANVPIISSGGRPPYGILQVDSRVPRDFTKSDTTFLSGYANLLAAAVDRLRTLSELRHLSRVSAMGTMAATLAHELNQPLEAISNYASGCENILEAGGFKAGKLQEGLRAIGAASVRAGDIIRRLREMTRNQANSSSRFRLSIAVTEAVGLVKAGGCEGASILCETHAPDWIWADRIEIEQVIVNLVKNACEAIQETGLLGTVTASIANIQGRIELTIKDDGNGMSAERAARLFQWADSSKAGGMGIGLSISRTIIERHGGKIFLDETSVAGTSFSFWLPESLELAEVDA